MCKNRWYLPSAGQNCLNVEIISCLALLSSGTGLESVTDVDGLKTGYAGRISLVAMENCSIWVRFL